MDKNSKTITLEIVRKMRLKLDDVTALTDANLVLFFDGNSLKIGDEDEDFYAFKSRVMEHFIRIML